VVSWIREVCRVIHMARANVYLPDELHEAARRADLNVSELTQRAIRDELEKRERLAAFAEFLDAGDTRARPPTKKELAEADAWAQEMLALARAAETAGPGRARRARRAG
jgi:post-segregation antitoxin (ccd killing protein)